MQNSVVIRLLEGRLAWYPPGAAEGPRWLEGDEAARDLDMATGQHRLPLCFAVPGEDVRLLLLPVSAEEKKHLGKSLPFMLEEAVAEDIENLHFAAGTAQDGEIPVAVCNRERMDAWQDLLVDCPAVSQWVPEPLLLPWQQGEWTLLLEPDRALVRLGSCQGFSTERECLPFMLEAALREAPPDRVVLYGMDQDADLAHLPEQVRDQAQWRRGNLYTAMMLGGPAGAAINLLQGHYARRLPLARWWRQWRPVAAVFAAAFALHTVVTYLDYLALKRENLDLRAALEQSYRQANPQGNMTDAEKQLQRQLQALKGSGQSSGFVNLIGLVGPAISQQPGTLIATINYSDRSGEIRMNILARDYQAVEKIRESINGAGLSAVMETSSAEGDAVRARLRVGGSS